MYIELEFDGDTTSAQRYPFLVTAQPQLYLLSHQNSLSRPRLNELRFLKISQHRLEDIEKRTEESRYKWFSISDLSS